jgi:hypothetical protein
MEATIAVVVTEEEDINIFSKRKEVSMQIDTFFFIWFMSLNLFIDVVPKSSPCFHLY